jgi:hypothetical protein
MNTIKSLRQIRWARYLMASNGFDPWLPAYMVAHHFSPHEILILAAIRQGVGFPLMYPTGLFADKLSRKTSLIVGASLCLVSMGLFVQAATWTDMLVASLSGIVGKAFFSGADIALTRALYQKQHPQGWKDRLGLFTAHYSRYQGLTEAATAVVATLLAAGLGLWAVIAAQGAVYITVMVLVLTLHEPDKLSRDAENPQLYHVDPTAINFEFLARAHPAEAVALSLIVHDPEYIPAEEIVNSILKLELGTLRPDGGIAPLQSLIKPTYSAPVPIHPAGLRPIIRRKRPFHVMQLPPTNHFWVLEVAYKPRAESDSYRVLSPSDFRYRWQSIAPRPLVGGPWVKTRGPARKLKVDQYINMVSSLERREVRRKLWSLVALLLGTGAMNSLTATTYRVAPLYYESIRLHGHPLPAAGYGWVWAAYLASLWLFGLGYHRLNALSVGKRLWTITGLGILGGSCYAAFGLIGAIWGLAAILGLALVRAQEGTLLTAFFNDLSSSRNQATVMSVLRMVQDGIAAGALLLLSLWTHVHGLGTGLIWVGALHAATTCLAFGGLAWLYRP